jgi:hypothetical protein
VSAGVSIREFARREGCDDALVRRALKREKLTAFEDGTLDPKLVGTAWRRGNRRADPDADKSADGPRPSADDYDPDFLDDFIANLLEGRFASVVEAERVKENALALKHLLDARRKAGELVDIDTAKAVLFEDAREERDAWINFPTKIGPLLAADLNVEPGPLIEALSGYVHQQLADLGDSDIDFAAADREAAA